MRIRYLAVAFGLLLILVFIAIFVKDSFVRPFLGDVLAVICLYFFVRCVFLNAKNLPLFIFIFAVTLEAMQYLNLAQILGIKNHIIKTIIGSTFDPIDIVCYGVGCLIAAMFERVFCLKSTR